MGERIAAGRYQDLARVDILDCSAILIIGTLCRPILQHDPDASANDHIATYPDSQIAFQPP